MTDERDPRMSRRYRELGSEEPSHELDQAILSAAHRAADRPHAPLVSPAGRHRWYFAFGAAAILVLAVAVTVQVERQQTDPEAVPATPAPPERTEGVLSYKDAPPPAAQQRKDAERSEPRKSVERSKAQPGFAQDPAPAAAPSEAPSSSTRTGPQADMREPGAAQVQRAPAAPSAEVLARAAPLSPERVLERIAELRKQGRHEEADKALAEFRQRYPDYRISEEMLQKLERKN
jgi:hypothetical protein